MTLSRNARLLIAQPLFAFVGLPALILWGAGWVIMFTGQNLWMVCHRRLRDPGCRCEECVQFDGALPREESPPTPPDEPAPSPPAA